MIKGVILWIDWLDPGRAIETNNGVMTEWASSRNQNDAQRVKLKLKASAIDDPQGTSRTSEIEGSIRPRDAKLGNLIQIAKDGCFEIGDVRLVNTKASVAIRATVGNISARNEKGWCAFSVAVAGFTSISGTFDNNKELIAGASCRIVGVPVEFRGKSALEASEISFLERELHDPHVLEFGRAGFSLSRDMVLTLCRAYGDNWPQEVTRDPKSVSDVFPSWRPSKLVKFIETAAVVAALGPSKLDFNAAGLKENEAERVHELMKKEPYRQWAAEGGFDARLFVPSGFLTLTQAKDANRHGEFFRTNELIGDATAAIWDELRLEAGRLRLKDDDPLKDRINARGSTALSFDQLCKLVWKNCAHDKASVRRAIDQNVFSALRSFQTPHGEFVALSRAERIERGLHAAVTRRLALKPFRATRVSFKPEFDKDQRAAVKLAIEHRVSIISGAAGVGKTTVCENVASHLGGTINGDEDESNAVKVLGVALSARAANVLKKNARIETLTIYRFFLYAQHPKFRGLKALIVDESSMISAYDMRKIFALADELKAERVILVGDPAQLRPIDEGQPFADFVASGIIPMVWLKINYREREAETAITALANDVREDRMTKDALLKGVYPGVAVVHEHDGDAALAHALNHYQRLIARGAKPKDIAFLSPFKKPGLKLSTDALNRETRKFLGFPTNRIIEGERVMGTRNDPKRGIVNGALGDVVSTAFNRFVIQFENLKTNKRMAFPKRKPRAAVQSSCVPNPV